MFITLEGSEGSGKTSQMGPLAEFLRQAGYDVLTTREPGGTAISDEVRAILFHKKESAGITQRTEILLFQAARAQLVEEVIRPALAQGKIVLSDRYADSTLAYQGYGYGNDLAALRLLLDYATGGLKPDLTLFLDLERVEEGIRRRRSSGGEWNRMDAYDLEFYERVRAGYLELAGAEPQRWVTLDADRPPAIVQADLRRVVLQRLEKLSCAEK